MKKKILTVILAAALSVSMICACGGKKSSEPAPAAETTKEDSAAEKAPAEEEAEEVEEEEVEEDVADGEDAADATEVSYYDGYYATNGEGSDFMLFFYETSAGDLAYINDGTNEAVAEYTVTEESLDDGTPYYLVKVGNLSLGYLFEGDDVYIVDDEGELYAGAQLSEEEAEALHSMVTE